MGNHKGTFMLVNITGPGGFDQSYWRYVKKYSDDEETTFKRAALNDARAQTGVNDPKRFRLGTVQKRATQPTNGMEI